MEAVVVEDTATAPTESSTSGPLREPASAMASSRVRAWPRLSSDTPCSDSRAIHRFNPAGKALRIASTARTAGEVPSYGTKDNGAPSGLLKLKRPARKDNANCRITEMPPAPSLKERESIIGSSCSPPSRHKRTPVAHGADNGHYAVRRQFAQESRRARFASEPTVFGWGDT